MKATLRLDHAFVRHGAIMKRLGILLGITKSREALPFLTSNLNDEKATVLRPRPDDLSGVWGRNIGGIIQSTGSACAHH